jgi:hypothetical protein
VVVGITIPTVHLPDIMEVVEVMDVKALIVVISHIIVRRIIISARTTIIIKSYLLFVSTGSAVVSRDTM